MPRKIAYYMNLTVMKIPFSFDLRVFNFHTNALTSNVSKALLKDWAGGASPSGRGVWPVETVCACAAQHDMTGKRSSALCHMTWVLSAPPSSQNQPAGLQEIEGGGQWEQRKPTPEPESQKERVECVKSVKSFPFVFRKSSFGFYQDQSLNDHPATKCANVCYRAVKRLLCYSKFGSALFYGPVPHVHTMYLLL